MEEADLRAFLALIAYICGFGKDITEFERRKLLKYSKELYLDIEDFNKLLIESHNDFTFEKAVLHFKDKGSDVKRYVYYEIYELIIADYIIFDEETERLEEIKKVFSLSEIEYKLLEEEAMKVKQGEALSSFEENKK